jgi:hypothetical protein
MTYLGGLLERLLRDSKKNDSVGTKTIFGGSLDILDNILALAEVDECVRAQLLAHLLLVVTGINGDSADTHGLAVLLSERTETTTSTDNGDCLSRTSTRLFDTLVDGDTSTKDW